MNPIAGYSPEDLGQQEYVACKGTVVTSNSNGWNAFINDTLSGRHCLNELPEAAPAMADDLPGDDVEGALSQRGSMRCAGRMQEDLPVRVSNILLKYSQDLGLLRPRLSCESKIFG